jgi:hypothetical protein
MRNIDLLNRDELIRIAGIREPGSVTIYVPTSAELNESDQARIEVKSRLREAVAQLEAASTDAAAIDSITNAVDELLIDGDFWRRQSNSLAIFVNRSTLSTFRVGDNLVGLTGVSDRFMITPLLRAATFGHSAFVLALSQNAVRLIDISPALSASEVLVPELPRDLKSTVALDLTNDRDTLAHLRMSEEPKVRMKEFSQAIDRALQPVLAQSDRPVVGAAAAPPPRPLPGVSTADEPLASIFRSVSSSPRLVEPAIGGNPEERSADELAASAAPILDAVHAKELATQVTRFEEASSPDLTDSTLDGVAVAATSKAIDTLFVDIDQHIPGYVDELSGVITRSETEDAFDYDVVDEIVRRALLSDARVIAVRAGEVPGAGPVAAILRFAMRA